MPFEIVRCDIAKLKADAVVGMADSPSANDGAAEGEARITLAEGDFAKYFIWAAVPVWQGGGRGEKEILERCYENSLKLARENKCESVAFPLLAFGNGGFPAAIAIEAAQRAIKKFLSRHEMKIFLAVPDRRAFRSSSRRYAAIKNYLAETYEEAERPKENSRYDVLSYLAKIPPIEKSGGSKTGLWKTAAKAKPRAAARRASTLCKMVDYSAASAADLDSEMAKMERSFSEELLRLIDAKGEKDSAVYKKANIDRRLFSKIRKNTAYQPSKMTALAFAVALELDLKGAADLIGRAGYAFSHSSRADIIVEYFIRHGQYDIIAINEALFAFKQPLLGG